MDVDELADALVTTAVYVARPMSNTEVAELRKRVREDQVVLKVYARLIATIEILQKGES